MKKFRCFYLRSVNRFFKYWRKSENRGFENVNLKVAKMRHYWDAFLRRIGCPIVRN
ncbi:hypothetical protein FQR65_LT02253 [Abscondita terminalis]|nr:hypothetical protein FQR65_LT02253 [Abscondita terminalis]